MQWKRRRLKNSRLYVIIDKESLRNRPVLEVARVLRNEPIDIVQYRDKVSDKRCILENSRSLRSIFFKSRIIFIVNDYPDIAKIVDADGLHLGQEDLSIDLARKILGPDRIIGISCHSLKQAREAQKRGADYLGIGPIFPTPTKPQCRPIGLSALIKVRKADPQVPFFAIGGISPLNLRRVRASGVNGVCVLSSICQAKDIHTAIKGFL